MRNYGTVLLGTIGYAVFAFAASVLLARTLGKDSFGAYSAFVALAVIFYQIMDVGLTASLVKYGSREYSEGSRMQLSRTFAAAFKSKALLACTLATGGFVVLSLVPLDLIREESTLIALAPVAGAVTSFFFLLQGATQIRGAFHRWSMALLLRGAGFLGGIILLVLIGLTSAVNVAAIYMLFAFLPVLFFRNDLRRCGLSIKAVKDSTWSEARRLLSFGKWISVSTVSFAVFEQLPIMTALVIFGVGSAAEFSVAFALIGVLGVFNVPLMTVVTPSLSRVKDLHDFREYFRSVYKFVAPLAAVMLVSLYALSETIIQIAYGETYSGAAPFFNAILLAFVVSFVTLPINASLSYVFGKPHLAAVVNLAQMISLLAMLTLIVTVDDPMALAVVYTLLRAGGSILVSVVAVAHHRRWNRHRIVTT